MTRRPTATPPYRAAAATAFGLMRVQQWRFDVGGLGHVPAEGGVVLTANHTSFWDYFTVGRGPWLAWGRPARILAKASLFRVPGFGALMRAAGHIPVHRGGGAPAIRDAVAALERGELILLLPEQTISRSFDLLPFKTGAVRIAAAARVPLVPAVSWGTHRFHTAGRPPRPAWRLPVVVRYGEPLHPTPDDDPAVVTATLRARTAALLDVAIRAYPLGSPGGAWWVPARLGGGAPAHEQAEAGHRALVDRWRRGV